MYIRLSIIHHHYYYYNNNYYYYYYYYDYYYFVCLSVSVRGLRNENLRCRKRVLEETKQKTNYV